MAINLSNTTTIGLQMGSTFFSHSLEILVYLQHQKMTCSHEPKINAGDDVAHSIMIPTNLPLWYSFSMTINHSDTIGLQAGSTFLPHSFPPLVYLQHQQLTCSHEPKNQCW